MVSSLTSPLKANNFIQSEFQSSVYHLFLAFTLKYSCFFLTVLLNYYYLLNYSCNYRDNTFPLKPTRSALCLFLNRFL